MTGNGRSFELPPNTRTRGNGPGVTWNCATDREIGNNAANCTQWSGSTAAGSVSAMALHTNGRTGAVEFDVTADVLDALTAGMPSIQWLIRRASEGQPGRATYHSADGAAARGDADLAPTLTVAF